MINNNNIIGCFVSINMGDEVGHTFQSYIWGEKGVCDALKSLNYEKYGKDLKIILLQYYINPIPYELKNLKEIENYRKKEGSLGIPIVINEEVFFSKTEMERYHYLCSAILEKIELLKSIVKTKKLDTNIELLKKDIIKIMISEDWLNIIE